MIIIAILIFIHIFFFIALVKQNFAVIDIAWGLGFILISLLAYVTNPLSSKNALMLTIVSIWGLRLALYIFNRGRGKGEDPRYAKLRAEWAPHPNLQAYFKVFLFQGFLMLVISSPVWMGMKTNESSISLVNWIGLGIWLTGFFFEVWADNYLRWWKSRPENKGMICMNGPWSLTRFPNYFGEVLLWYGTYLFCFELKTSWTIIGPLTLNFLILKVTGVPLLEEKYMKREDYQEYAKRVPRFIPFTKP